MAVGRAPDGATDVVVAVLTPVFATTELVPSETRLSKIWKRSPAWNRSVSSSVAGPLKVQGGPVVTSATGLTVGMQPPAQACTAEVAWLNKNSWKPPLTPTGSADASGIHSVTRRTIPSTIRIILVTSAA